jgi:hypothetical protein
VIESIVRGSGRSVLIVPHARAFPASFKSVLVAWDGSAPAARALGDALPLVAHADRVEFLTVDARGTKGHDELGAALMQHLSRHGIEAKFNLVPSLGDIGATLLFRAADMGADERA